mmetsp:Transcript_22928/g.42146  ORF Transcript_22928/g.42146 Transcript_22928/m.42146 type:complete len:181 (+) Transcript_22928:81-623(+)
MKVSAAILYGSLVACVAAVPPQASSLADGKLEAAPATATSSAETYDVWSLAKTTAVEKASLQFLALQREVQRVTAGMEIGLVLILGIVIAMLALCMCLLAKNNWSVQGASEEGKSYVHSMASSLEQGTRGDPNYHRANPYATSMPQQGPPQGQGYHGFHPFAHHQQPPPPPQAQRPAGCC